MYENKMVSRRTEERRYMCLIVIWYWYKSTFERFLFRFSLLIGNLEVSGADLAIYLCQSEVTSHFCDVWVAVYRIHPCSRGFFVFMESVRKCAEILFATGNVTTGMWFYNSRSHNEVTVRVLLLLLVKRFVQLFPFAVGELAAQFSVKKYSLLSLWDD